MKKIFSALTMLGMAGLLAFGLFSGSSVVSSKPVAAATATCVWTSYRFGNIPFSHVFDNSQQKYTNVNVQVEMDRDGCGFYQGVLFGWVDDGSSTYFGTTSHSYYTFGTTNTYDGGVIKGTGSLSSPLHGGSVSHYYAVFTSTNGAWIDLDDTAGHNFCWSNVNFSPSSGCLFSHT